MIDVNSFTTDVKDQILGILSAIGTNLVCPVIAAAAVIYCVFQIPQLFKAHRDGMQNIQNVLRMSLTIKTRRGAAPPVSSRGPYTKANRGLRGTTCLGVVEKKAWTAMCILKFSKL